MMRGAHVISHWARTQQLIALSSAEAELNAATVAGQGLECILDVVVSDTVHRPVVHE